MNEFENSNWNKADYSQQYLDEADIYIPERENLLRILASFYRKFIVRDKKKRILDLGCGNGILSKTLYNQQGSMEIIVTDGSKDMLLAAKKELKGIPVKEFCLAYQGDKQTEFPIRNKKKKIPHYNIAVGIIQKKDKILITKRKPEGLLGGLWEFPGGKIKSKETPVDACGREVNEELNLNIDVIRKLTQVKHTYTHFKISMWVYICEYRGGKISLKSAVEYRWIKVQELDNFPFPGANHKFLSMVKSFYNSGH